MQHGVRLLGLVPAETAADLAARLGAEVRCVPLGAVAALLQPAEAPARTLLLNRDRSALLRQLAALQKRLELLCQAGPFLACDPGMAISPEVELVAMLQSAQGELGPALQRHGSRHQWDVILRWSPEAVLSARRNELQPGPRRAMAEAIAALLQTEVAARRTALAAALRPCALGMAEAAPVQGDAETGVTLIIPAGGEAMIESALGSLPGFATADARCELRGPLPALIQGALRILPCDPAALGAAWDRLALPESLEAGELTPRWRSLATRLHPDTGAPGASTAAMAEASAAYRLLRQQVQRQSGPLSRKALLSRPSRYLDIPLEAA
jgi:hypothetical protein